MNLIKRIFSIFFNPLSKKERKRLKKLAKREQKIKNHFSSEFFKKDCRHYKEYFCPNVDALVDRIINESIQIEADEYYISGILTNGQPFFFWNANKWHAWMNLGQVGDERWSKMMINNHPEISYQKRTGQFVTKRMFDGGLNESQNSKIPSDKARIRMKNFLISIHEDFVDILLHETSKSDPFLWKDKIYLVPCAIHNQKLSIKSSKILHM